MITVPKIIGGVCAILIIITGAYFVINSKNVDGDNIESVTPVPNVESAPDNSIPATSPTEARSNAIPDPVPEPIVTPKPNPTPIPVPAPISTPTPAEKTGYTISEVAQHNDATSCYGIINGGVYDLTSFIKKHPGGAANIMKICGKDGTSLFENQHGGDTKPESTLASFYLGAFIK